MKIETRKFMNQFKEDLINFQSKKFNSSIELQIIKDNIKILTNEYINTDDIKLKNKYRSELAKYYNLLYYYQYGIYGEHRVFLLDDDISKLPSVYTIEEKPQYFDLNNELLSNLDFTNGLSEEQAIELLKWTANNTRNNLDKSIDNGNVYENYDLCGLCGYSQFLSLYPLQQLGLHVTINNIHAFGGGKHAFGTVILPIRVNDRIVNKRYLIDCTYNQFFTLPFNVVTRYIKGAPFNGYFNANNPEYEEFSRGLLRDGFVEATPENMEKYLKPFLASKKDYKEVEFIDSDFSKIDVIDVLENKQMEFDYSYDEFIDSDINLEFNVNNKKIL